MPSVAVAWPPPASSNWVKNVTSVPSVEHDGLVVDRLARGPRIVDRPRRFPRRSAIGRAAEIRRPMPRRRTAGPRRRTRSPRIAGSAAIESLSLKLSAPSRISVDGLAQLRPPSSDRLTTMALVDPGAFTCARKRDRRLIDDAVGADRDPRVGRQLVVAAVAGVAAGAAGKGGHRRRPRAAAVERRRREHSPRTAVRPPVLLPDADEIGRVGGIRSDIGLDFGVGVERARDGRAFAARCEGRQERHAKLRIRQRRIAGRRSRRSAPAVRRPHRRRTRRQWTTLQIAPTARARAKTRPSCHVGPFGGRKGPILPTGTLSANCRLASRRRTRRKRRKTNVIHGTAGTHRRHGRAPAGVGRARGGDHLPREAAGRLVARLRGPRVPRRLAEERRPLAHRDQVDPRDQGQRSGPARARAGPHQRAALRARPSSVRATAAKATCRAIFRATTSYRFRTAAATRGPTR